MTERCKLIWRVHQPSRPNLMRDLSFRARTSDVNFRLFVIIKSMCYSAFTLARFKLNVQLQSRDKSETPYRRSGNGENELNIPCNFPIKLILFDWIRGMCRSVLCVSPHTHACVVISNMMNNRKYFAVVKVIGTRQNCEGRIVGEMGILLENFYSSRALFQFNCHWMPAIRNSI